MRGRGGDQKKRKCGKKIKEVAHARARERSRQRERERERYSVRARERVRERDIDSVRVWGKERQTKREREVWADCTCMQQGLEPRRARERVLGREMTERQ